MKTLTQICAAVLVLLAILLFSAATGPGNAPAPKGENENAVKDVSVSPSGDGVESLQCGVSNDQIKRYLETCSHHHTVYWVEDIPGTCNSKAGIENGKTATVYVENGIIVSHQDSAGYSDDTSGDPD